MRKEPTPKKDEAALDKTSNALEQAGAKFLETVPFGGIVILVNRLNDKFNDAIVDARIKSHDVVPLTEAFLHLIETIAQESSDVQLLLTIRTVRSIWDAAYPALTTAKAEGFKSKHRKRDTDLTKALAGDDAALYGVEPKGKRKPK